MYDCLSPCLRCSRIFPLPVWRCAVNGIMLIASHIICHRGHSRKDIRLPTCLSLGVCKKSHRQDVNFSRSTDTAGCLIAPSFIIYWPRKKSIRLDSGRAVLAANNWVKSITTRQGCRGEKLRQPRDQKRVSRLQDEDKTQ